MIQFNNFILLFALRLIFKLVFIKLLQKLQMAEIRKNWNGQPRQVISTNFSSNYNQEQDFYINFDDSEIQSDTESCGFAIEIQNCINMIEFDLNLNDEQMFRKEDQISISSFEDISDKLSSQIKMIQQINLQKESNITKQLYQKQKQAKREKIRKKKLLKQLKPKERKKFFRSNIKSAENLKTSNLRGQSQNKIIEKEISPINFRRSFALQQLINQKYKDFKLIRYLIKTSKFFHREIQELPFFVSHIPVDFGDVQQYEQKFKAAHQLEVIFAIHEKVNQIKSCPSAFEANQFSIISQSTNQDGLYEYQIQPILEENIRNYLNIKKIFSKYRLFYLITNNEIDNGVLAGVIEHPKKFIIITCRILEFGSNFLMYEIDKLTTQIRQYEAILKMKYFPTSSQILAPHKHFRKSVLKYSQFEQLKILTGLLKNKFNSSQFEAIQQISLSNEGIHLIQGPPGTGKTSVLLGLLSCQLLKLSYFNKFLSNLNLKILICTPSNAAADHITKRIIDQGLFCPIFQKRRPKILRIGIADNQQIRNVSLLFILKELYDIQEKKAFITVSEINIKIHELKRKIGELSQMNQENYYQFQYAKWYLSILQAQVTKVKDGSAISIKQLVPRIQKIFITGVSIVVTTLSSSFNQKMIKNNLNFSCLIVDEAGQASQPTTLIPLQYGMSKVILIGDPKQLSPVTMHPISLKNGYCKSLFQRLMEGGINPHFLQIQYRMQSLIRKFPSLYFYNDRLKDSSQCYQRASKVSFAKCKSVVLIKCENSRENRIDKTYCNTTEAKLIIQLLSKLSNKQLAIGVISPYQGQCEMIRKMVNYKKIQNTTVSTVDSYQGQQRDIIIISAVRANQNNSLGFIVDEKRMNVALTRSKYLLIVVGNPKTLASNRMWDNYIKWAQKEATCINYDSETHNLGSVITQLFQ